MKTLTSSKENDDDAPEIMASYSLRSKVLGGQVISETGPTGKKKKTNVYAAGTQIATQSEHINPFNSALVQNVYFTHSDASGMSNRSTTGNGSYFGTEGFEGAPAETDPMGGNMGMATPYIEIHEPIEHPDPTMMPPLPIEDESPMMVNGQAVQCTLDGMTIGCATAMGMMQSGSAIPAALARYQHLPGFQFNSQGLGIYNVTVPYEVPGVYTVTTTSTGGTTSDQQWVWNPGYMSSKSFSFSFNWNTAGQTGQSASLKPKDQKNLEKGLELLKKLEINEKCQKNVIDKLEDKLGFDFKEFQDFLAKGYDFFDGTRSTVAIAGNVTFQQPADSRYGVGATVSSIFANTKGNRRIDAMASITSPTLKVYFRPSSISGNTKSNAAFLFHEALHGFGGTKGGTSYFDSDLQKALFGENNKKVGEASSNITEHIKKYCF